MEDEQKAKFGMTIGIIGAGALGSSFARVLARKGLSATISNSRGPTSLAGLVEELGPSIRAVDLGAKHSSEIIKQFVPGARLVKAFNHNDVGIFREAEAVAGKRVLFYSGDDVGAKAEVRAMMEACGFAPVDLGTLAVGGPLASLPFGPLAMHNFLAC